MLDPLAFGAILLFGDPRVHLADMNGDRLQDMVLVTDEQVVYFRSRGRGDFDDAVLMAQSPSLTGAPPRRLLSDINGDGLSDCCWSIASACTPG